MAHQDFCTLKALQQCFQAFASFEGQIIVPSHASQLNRVTRSVPLSVSAEHYSARHTCRCQGEQVLNLLPVVGIAVYEQSRQHVGMSVAQAMGCHQLAVELDRSLQRLEKLAAYANEQLYDLDYVHSFRWKMQIYHSRQDDQQAHVQIRDVRLIHQVKVFSFSKLRSLR
jgi:hypothetical protein